MQNEFFLHVHSIHHFLIHFHFPCPASHSVSDPFRNNSRQNAPSPSKEQARGQDGQTESPCSLLEQLMMAWRSRIYPRACIGSTIEAVNKFIMRIMLIFSSFSLFALYPHSHFCFILWKLAFIFKAHIHIQKVLLRKCYCKSFTIQTWEKLLIHWNRSHYNKHTDAHPHIRMRLMGDDAARRDVNEDY